LASALVSAATPRRRWAAAPFGLLSRLRQALALSVAALALEGTLKAFVLALEAPIDRSLSAAVRRLAIPKERKMPLQREAERATFAEWPPIVATSHRCFGIIRKKNYVAVLDFISRSRPITPAATLSI
jgi:hypothetical protein